MLNGMFESNWAFLQKLQTWSKRWWPNQRDARGWQVGHHPWSKRMHVDTRQLQTVWCQTRWTNPASQGSQGGVTPEKWNCIILMSRAFFSQIVGDMTNVSWIFVFDCWYIPVFDGPSLNSNLCVILNQADRIVIAPWTKSGGFFRRPGLRSYIRWTWCHPLRSGAVPWGGSRDGLNRVAAKLGNGGTSWDTESLRPDFF